MIRKPKMDVAVKVAWKCLSCVLVACFIFGCSSPAKPSVLVSHTTSNTTVNNTNLVETGLGTNQGIVVSRSTNVNAASIGTLTVAAGGIGINQGTIVKLESSTQNVPRHITPEKRAEFIAEAKNVPKLAVVLFVTAQDAETYAFAE